MALVEQERRRLPRLKLSEGRVHLPVSGKVLDASLQGVAIETTQSLRPDWSYGFKLEVGNRVVSIPGRVAWCERVGSRETTDGREEPVFRLGVELVGNIWSRRQIYAYP